MKVFLLSPLFLLLLASPLQAKDFSNEYIRFSLPKKWDCYNENSNWVCRYTLSKSCRGKERGTPTCRKQLKKSKEAIIILTAKAASADDNIPNYLAHMKTSRPVILEGGKKARSKVIHTKTVNVNDHSWVDGMHLASEIPYYYTRYLATVKGDVAILVTFSAHKRYYTKYSSAFFKTIKSMRILTNRLGGKNIPKLNKNKPLGATLPPVDIPDDPVIGDIPVDAPSNDSSTTLLLLLAFVMAGLGVFIWLRGRKP